MLTASRIRNAKPKAKPCKLFDGRGLYLEVRPNGGKWWRYKYRRPGTRKENTLSLGTFPDVSLRKARARLQAARDLLADGIDPGEARKADKQAAAKAAEPVATFAECARKWMRNKAPGWSDSSREKARLVVDDYLIPALGDRPIASLTSADVLAVLRDMDRRAPSLARKAAGAANAIVRVAISEGVREEGRLLDLNLRDNLPRQRKGHLPAATTPASVATVMRAIQSIASPVTRAALLVCAYTAQRPGNVAAMRWDDLDLAAAEWLIPAEVMKMRNAHIVPLSRQVVALVEGMREYTGGRGYVFPPIAQQGNSHLHRDALSKALRDAGLQGKQTPHGLRATLRTVARERLGIPADVLEAQLAHAKRGETQAAYDRGTLLDERLERVQEWCDYLDALAAGGDVVAFKRRAARRI
ncbi:MAG TPA: integrase arm-type DNA-binding domain-containing protein [Rhodanobacteraceae bacterium]|nr:integrase arm-type DNA-binding domain-containing protein [Rhodanobacteraceae bacterium]